ELTLGPAVFNRHVVALDVPALLETLAKCGEHVRKRIGRCLVEKSDHRHCRLLRARRERPCGSRAAEQRDERAAPHSITLSASASSLSGIWRPSAFADFRLITSSRRVGCTTGRSEGLA